MQCPLLDQFNIMFCDLELEFSSSFVAMLQINKTVIHREPITSQLVTFYTVHGVSTNIVCHSSTQQGFSMLINNFFCLTFLNKQSVRHWSMYRTISTNFKRLSVRIAVVRQTGHYQSWLVQLNLISPVLQMLSNMGTLIWLFLVPCLLKTTALLISQCTLQKVSAWKKANL